MAHTNHLGTARIRAQRARKVRRDWPIHTFPQRNGTRPGKRGVPVIAYDTALTESAYGNLEHLGLIVPDYRIKTTRPMQTAITTIPRKPATPDLFNSIMGAVVPGWDTRPDWMKKIRVKPDPVKIFQQASKAVPPERIEQIVDIARQYGVTGYYAGQEITPGGAGFAAGMARAGAQLAEIPGWVWLAGGGVVLILVMSMGRRS